MKPLLAFVALAAVALALYLARPTSRAATADPAPAAEEPAADGAATTTANRTEAPLGAPAPPARQPDPIEAVYGARSAEIKQLAEAAARASHVEIDWQNVEPWESAHEQMLAWLTSDEYRGSFLLHNVDWPGITLDAPITPAEGATLEAVIRHLERLTGTQGRITREIAVRIDTELLATHTEIQIAARHARDLTLADIEHRLRTGDFDKAPGHSTVIEAIAGRPHPRHDPDSLGEHTHTLAGWGIRILPTRSTAPALAAATDDLAALKTARDATATARTLELVE